MLPIADGFVVAVMVCQSPEGKYIYEYINEAKEQKYFIQNILYEEASDKQVFEARLKGTLPEFVDVPNWAKYVDIADRLRSQ